MLFSWPVGIGVQTAGREAAGTCFNSRWWYDLVLGWLGLKAALLNGTSVAMSTKCSMAACSCSSDCLVHQHWARTSDYSVVTLTKS